MTKNKKVYGPVRKHGSEPEKTPNPSKTSNSSHKKVPDDREAKDFLLESMLFAFKMVGVTLTHDNLKFLVDSLNDKKFREYLVQKSILAYAKVSPARKALMDKQYEAMCNPN